MKTILITGGSGMIGQHLTKRLSDKGYNVIWLSRERFVKAKVPRYRWDYLRGEIDTEAVEQADSIVHLAGANLGEGAWTRHRKQQIVESRVQTAKLLLATVRKMGKRLDAFISASAVGYYGMVTRERPFVETDQPAANDFLSRTCKKWESAANGFHKELGVRTVVLRTAFVVSEDSAGLQKMKLPTRFGLGAPLGSGKQTMPWVHVEDLCNMYLRAIEEAFMKGVYNTAAPEVTTNAMFMRTLAKEMNRPFIFPRVPSFLMRLIMGESAGMVLEGSPVSSEKITREGFIFQYPTLEKAMRDAVNDRSGAV